MYFITKANSVMYKTIPTVYPTALEYSGIYHAVIELEVEERMSGAYLSSTYRWGSLHQWSLLLQGGLGGIVYTLHTQKEALLLHVTLKLSH